MQLQQRLKTSLSQCQNIQSSLNLCFEFTIFSAKLKNSENCGFSHYCGFCYIKCPCSLCTIISWSSSWGHKHSWQSSKTRENWTRLPLVPLQNPFLRRVDNAFLHLGTSYSPTSPPWSHIHLIPASICPMAHKIARRSLPSLQNNKCVDCQSCGRVAIENTTGKTVALKDTKKVYRMFGKRELSKPHQPSQKGSLPGLHHWHALTQISCQNGFVHSLCPSLSEKKMHVSSFNITDSFGCFPPPFQQTSAKWQCWQLKRPCFLLHPLEQKTQTFLHESAASGDISLWLSSPNSIISAHMPSAFTFTLFSPSDFTIINGFNEFPLCPAL